MSAEPDFDFCVIGSGAGGGILAYRLAEAGHKVVTLEAGPRILQSYFAEENPPGSLKDWGIRPDMRMPGDPHAAIFEHPLFAKDADRSTVESAQGRFAHYQLLALGGLQNLWNGVSVRFAPRDFGDWPIGYDALERHYGETEELITVCGTEEGVDILPDGKYIPPKPLRRADRLVVDSVASLGRPNTKALPNRKAIETRPGRENSCASFGYCTAGCPKAAVYKFPARLLPRIESKANYALMTDSRAVGLVTSKDGKSISAVRYVDTKTGEFGELKARCTIVAAGAVESPRLLLNSASEAHPAGLGNQGDAVGRYLQDNPKVAYSTSSWKLWGKKADEDIGYGDQLIILAEGTTEDGETFPFIGHTIHAIPELPYYLEGLEWAPEPLKGWLARTMFMSYLTLATFCPGEPIYENRLKLSKETDRFGVPKLDIDYAFSRRARQQQRAMTKFCRQVLRRAGGTLIMGSEDEPGTGIHYAGSTRMSADAEDGVVDADLKVHGLDNLYVCDGGVIPVLPDKHLTLTIMALANRLAAHLDEKKRAA